MFLSDMSVLVVVQLSSEVPEGLMNNPVVQLIWVPGNMGIDGNEVPEQLAKQGS
jgi:hypothetical protein